MTKDRTKYTTLLLVFFTAIGRGAGLLREMMLSYFYGASVYSDAYVVATTFSSIIFAGIAAAVLNGFIPIATKYKNDLEMYTRSLFFSTSVISISLACILIIFLKPLLRIITIGFDMYAITYTWKLSVIVIAVSPMLCQINVLIAYMQMKGNFYLTSFQSIISNVIMIIVFAITVGNPISLGLGFGVSLLIPFSIIIFISRVKGFCFGTKNNMLCHSYSIETWKLIFPTLGMQLATQINSIIDRSFASSLGTGVVSYMKYAFLLCNMVVSVIAVSIGMVGFPKLSSLIANGKDNDAILLYANMIKKVIFIIMPCAFGFIFFSEDIICILFEHGEFSFKDTISTARILCFYSFTMLGWAIQEISGRYMMAKRKTRSLFFLYVIYVLLNISFNYSLIKTQGEIGLALGTTLATGISACTMILYIFNKKCKNKKVGIIKELCHSIMASAGAVVGCLLFDLVIKYDMSRIVHLVFCSFLALAIYILLMFLMRDEILANITSVLFSKVSTKHLH